MENILKVKENGFIHVLWDNVQPIETSIKDWNLIIDKLNKEGIPQYKAYKEKIPNKDGLLVQKRRITSWNKINKDYNCKVWFVYATDTYKELCVVNGCKYPYFYRYYIRSGNTIAEKPTMTGYEAFSNVRDSYEDVYGIKMTEDFGTNTIIAKENKYELKKLVPSPFNWATPIKLKNYWFNVNKADVSSAYPASLIKSLPTWNDALKIDGYATPNKEYPFAFHLKSRNIEILEDDGTITSTQELINSKEYMEVSQKTINVYDKVSVDGKTSIKMNKFENISKEEDITILMKKVQSDAMKKVMIELYKNRKEFSENKDIMNMFIGFCHFYRNPEYPQIAAVSQLRCAVNMVRRMAELKKNNCVPLLVNTDSISWLGNYFDLTVPQEQKDIGKFVLEYTELQMNIESCKKYQYLTKDGICYTRIAGAVGIAEYKNKFKFGEFTIPGIKFNHYGFERESGKFIEIEME